jgi:hypothetical protein
MQLKGETLTQKSVSPFVIAHLQVAAITSMTLGVLLFSGFDA